MDSIWTNLYAYLWVTAAAGVGAAVLYWKRQAGKRWLPIPRLRWGRWTGADVVLTVIMFTIAQSLVAAVLQRTQFFDWFYGQEPSALRQSLWARPFNLPLFLLLTFAGLRLFSGTYPVDLGVSLSRWPANVLLGYVAFVVVTPVVLAFFILLTLLPGVKQHQFVELSQTGLVPVEWGLMFFSAAIAAPISEELLFRGLIQGWLRRASLAGHIILIMLIMLMSFSYSIKVKDAGKNQPPTPQEIVENMESPNWPRLVITVSLGILYLIWLFRLQEKNLFLTAADYIPEDSEPADLQDGEVQEETPSRKDIEAALLDWKAQDQTQQHAKTGLAIFGSALAFGLVHPSWPDPLPLLVLGVALGWLAQRTQNLLPSMVLHALFNSVATLTLLFEELARSR